MTTSNDVKDISTTDSVLQLVTFMVGGEEFGVDIHNVQEINKMMPMTRVPKAPDFIEGIVNLRGRVIPVIDLRTRLGMQKRPHDNDSRIIIAEIENRTFGFVVDAVKEVLRISETLTEPPPGIVSGIDSDLIKSIGKLDHCLLIMIDFNKILMASEKEELHAAMANTVTA
jgi:purine-binding chemotaxis protein CheW